LIKKTFARKGGRRKRGKIKTLLMSEKLPRMREKPREHGSKGKTGEHVEPQGRTGERKGGREPAGIEYISKKKEYTKNSRERKIGRQDISTFYLFREKMGAPNKANCQMDESKGKEGQMGGRGEDRTKKMSVTKMDQEASR